MAQWLTNPARNYEVEGLIPGLAQWVRVRHCHELWCRLQMWLGSGVAVPVATAPIQPLAWEPPCAMGAALKRQNKQTQQVQG